MPASLIERRAAIARLTLHWVVLAMLLNLVFNLVSALSGRGYPFSTFLWRPDDDFGDFFSLLHSYPGGDVAVVHDRVGLHGILPAKPISLTVVSDPVVTNFHMTPLSTMIDLGLLRLLRWVDPVAVFVALFDGVVAGWGATALRFAKSRREALLWTVAAAISYPFLMTVVRGNLFAGFTALLLVQALLLGIARRAPVTSAMLLAVACNFRPNAILFAVPLLLFYWPQRWRFAVALGASGLAVLATSLVVSTTFYPAYTPAAIRTGLANYYTLYVVRGWGLAYGSSLFGMLRVLVGAHPGLDGLALGISLATLSSGGLAWMRARIDDATMVFLTTASYCLGSTVLGDYHLLVCIATPMAIAGTDGGDAVVSKMRQVALLASCLVLAPKNYLFFGPLDRPISLQVLVNPMLLLAASAFVLALAIRRSIVPRRKLAMR